MADLEEARDPFERMSEAVADPDLELRGRGGGGGLDFLALLALFPSVISSFLPKIRGGGEGEAPGPSPRSASEKARTEHPKILYPFPLTQNFESESTFAEFNLPFLGANHFYFFKCKNGINSNTSTPSLHIVKTSRSAIGLYRE